MPRDFLLAALIVALGIVISRFTRLGRFTYAIGNNEQIARDNGVPVARYKVYVFLIAAVCCALAGVIASMQIDSGAPTVGVGTLFLTIAAVVIGGTSLGGGKAESSGRPWASSCSQCSTTGSSCPVSAPTFSQPSPEVCSSWQSWPRAGSTAAG